MANILWRVFTIFNTRGHQHTSRSIFPRSFLGFQHRRLCYQLNSNIHGIRLFIMGLVIWKTKHKLLLCSYIWDHGSNFLYVYHRRNDLSSLDFFKPVGLKFRGAIGSASRCCCKLFWKKITRCYKRVLWTFLLNRSGDRSAHRGHFIWFVGLIWLFLLGISYSWNRGINNHDNRHYSKPIWDIQLIKISDVPIICLLNIILIPDHGPSSTAANALNHYPRAPQD